MSTVRVLILSNDGEFLAAVGEALRGRSQFEVVRCSGLISVLPHPDLIVIDLDAPPPRWWKSILALRRRDQSLPLVAVSSALPAGARLGAWRPRGYVRKPFDMDDLLRVADDVLRDVQALDRWALPRASPGLATQQDHRGQSLAADLAA